MKDIFSRIRTIHIKTTRTVESLFAGEYHSAFKGVGLQFEDLREYIPGDDIQRIDWHATARNDRLYIKNFREERELTVLLVVDVSASTRFGSKGRIKKDIIAEIGAVLALSATKNHDNVGLLLFSDQVELFLRPKKTLRHVLRCIRELLYFEPRHKGTDISQALGFLGNVQKRPSIVFLISDFFETQFFHAASLIAKKHDLILVDVYDHLEHTFPQLGCVRLRDLETDEMRLVDTSDPEVQTHFTQQVLTRKVELKEESGRLGIDLLSINCNESYVDALHNFFKLRRKH